MYMPRLSLYKPERGNDYHFLDKQIQEMFTVGGTDINIHKYIGPQNPLDEDRSATRKCSARPAPRARVQRTPPEESR